MVMGPLVSVPFPRTRLLPRDSRVQGPNTINPVPLLVTIEFATRVVVPVPLQDIPPRRLFATSELCTFISPAVAGQKPPTLPDATLSRTEARPPDTAITPQEAA